MSSLTIVVIVLGLVVAVLGALGTVKARALAERPPHDSAPDSVH